MKKKSIRLNAILNIFKTLLTIVFPLITFPYVSRILQASNIGKVQFATSIVSYFSLFASLGISTYAIREGSSLRDNSAKLNDFCNQIFSFNIISTFISYFLLGITLFFMNKAVDYKYLIMIQSLTILFTTLGVDWINSIFEDYIYITIRTIIIQLFVLLLTFLLINDSNDYYLYAVVLVISGVGANILNFFYVRKYIKVKFTWKIDIKKHLKPILILFSSTLATTIYNSSDITMLGILCGDYVVGIYYVGSKIYTILKQLLNSAIAVTIPRISFYNSSHNENEKNILLNHILKLMIIVVLPFAVGLFVLSSEIIIIISGESYLQASVSLMILSFALIFAVLANFFSNLILVTHYQEKKSSIITIIAACVNFILNFLFIPMWKENGAALTTVIAEFIVVIFSLYYSKKYFKPTKLKRILLSSVLGCLLIYIYSVFIKFLNLNLFLELVLIFIGSLIIYLPLMYMLNKKEFKKLFSFKKNFNRIM